MRLLVLGGSLGARVFSDVVPGALAACRRTLRARLSVAQQCRAEDLDRVRAAYAAQRHRGRAGGVLPRRRRSAGAPRIW